MIVVTTPNVEGRTITQVHGLATGSTIRAKVIFKDIGAGLKSVVGGELGSYTKMMQESGRRRSSAWRRTPPAWAETPWSTCGSPRPWWPRAPRRSWPTEPPSPWSRRGRPARRSPQPPRNISFTRRSSSSGDTSSMWVATPQRWPQGSSNCPERSP